MRFPHSAADASRDRPGAQLPYIAAVAPNGCGLDLVDLLGFRGRRNRHGLFLTYAGTSELASGDGRRVGSAVGVLLT
jgi:hypothetical protein